MLGLPTVRLRTGSVSCTMVDLPTGTVTSLWSRIGPVQFGPLTVFSRAVSARALPMVSWIGPLAAMRSGLVGAAMLLVTMALSTPACACAVPSHRPLSAAAASAVALRCGPTRRCLPQWSVNRSMMFPQTVIPAWQDL